MPMSTRFVAVAIGIGWSMSVASLAQAAPGEDTVTISKPVTYLALPTMPRAPSGSIRYTQDLPPGTAAKVGRYTADAYAATPSSNVKTDRDVVQSVKTNGLYTTCNQSVASTTGPAGPGGTSLNSQDQIVVLRGDMINICN